MLQPCVLEGTRPRRPTPTVQRRPRDSQPRKAAVPPTSVDTELDEQQGRGRGRDVWQVVLQPRPSCRGA
eukprot:7237085-Alexandrium_andersonii.AAC.1